MWRLLQPPSCASQIIKNPIEEMNQNTYNSSETLRLLLKESRESQRRSNSQFVITTLITLATLFFAALPYIEPIKSFFRLIHF